MDYEHCDVCGQAAECWLVLFFPSCSCWLGKINTIIMFWHIRFRNIGNFSLEFTEYRQSFFRVLLHFDVSPSVCPFRVFRVSECRNALSRWGSFAVCMTDLFPQPALSPQWSLRAFSHPCDQSQCPSHLMCSASCLKMNRSFLNEIIVWKFFLTMCMKAFRKQMDAIGEPV